MNRHLAADCPRPRIALVLSALACSLLATSAARADATANASLGLSRPLVLSGIDQLFVQSRTTRTPDGRNHEHLKTKDPACPAQLELVTGITGDLRAAHLMVPATSSAAVADGTAAIPDCAVAIANRFFNNIAARTPEGAELAKHAVADALANPHKAYATVIGDKTASVRFDPDLRGLFAFIDADPN